MTSEPAQLEDPKPSHLPAAFGVALIIAMLSASYGLNRRCPEASYGIDYSTRTSMDRLHGHIVTFRFPGGRISFSYYHKEAE